MMLSLLVLVAVVSLTSAFVCPPNYCDGVTQPDLNCKGNVIPHAGFCGCYSICAKVEGEGCSYLHLMGLPNTAICDEGLECSVTKVDSVQAHRCTKSTDVKITSQVVKRGNQCDTRCRRKSAKCAISTLVYPGQWFAKCDADGNFLPDQCDNSGHCFCVDTFTGSVLDGTEILGTVNCLITDD